MSYWSLNKAGCGLTTEKAPPPAEEVALGQSLRAVIRRLDQVTLVALCGSAGMAEAQDLRGELESLADEEAPVIVLDLQGLDFIGSPGLAAIIFCHLKECRHHGQIRLVAPQPAVLEVFERIRLTELFPVYASVEEAMTL